MFLLVTLSLLFQRLFLFLFFFFLFFYPGFMLSFGFLHNTLHNFFVVCEKFLSLLMKELGLCKSSLQIRLLLLQHLLLILCIIIQQSILPSHIHLLITSIQRLYTLQLQCFIPLHHQLLKHLEVLNQQKLFKYFFMLRIWYPRFYN